MPQKTILKGLFPFLISAQIHQSHVQPCTRWGWLANLFLLPNCLVARLTQFFPFLDPCCTRSVGSVSLMFTGAVTCSAMSLPACCAEIDGQIDVPSSPAVPFDSPACCAEIDVPAASATGTARRSILASANGPGATWACLVQAPPIFVCRSGPRVAAAPASFSSCHRTSNGRADRCLATARFRFVKSTFKCLCAQPGGRTVGGRAG